MSDDGFPAAEPAGSGSLAPAPAMPRVPRYELYRGTPILLLDSGFRRSLGWQDHRLAGPCFVVVRKSPLGRIKVTDRHPLTEEGWEGAWRTLAGADSKAAAAIAARLAGRAARDRAAAGLDALDARSLRCLRRVTFSGGTDGVPLTKGSSYDVRFLSDQVVICPCRSTDAVAVVPYRDVGEVEVSGSTSGMSTEMTVLMTLAVGLLGALLGLLVYRIPGLVLGFLIFAAVGALIGGAGAKIETTVRVRGQDAEFYFLDTQRRAEALRIELAEPLKAIETARAARAGREQAAAEPAAGPEQPPGEAAAPVTDRLSQLASLLQQGLLTRDEFDHLKAKLIAGS